MTASSKRMAELFNSSPVKKKRMKLEDRLKTKVAPLSEQKKAVTPQHWIFIQTLVDGEGKSTLKDAAIAAGYPEKKAALIAHELTNPKQNPQVVAAIQQYRQDLAERYGTNIDRHMRDLQNIRDKALEAGNYSAAVQAEYRRGQALGTIYVERKEIRHGTIDSMSVDEVRRKLEDIKLLYGDPSSIIDVTPLVDEIIHEDIPDGPESEEIEFEDVEEEPKEVILEKPKKRTIIDEMREAKINKLITRRELK
jgi:phage terminase small subunit